MSLFGGLDGVVESVPTLIDEEDLFFGGGEDLFEFLDEAATSERVPTALIAPAPLVTAPPPTIENREPSGYTAPSFFPFGKPEPTAPQLKLSGVSSFKKINSRLLQGGALSDREEADAIRELERALGVLGHQKRFLREHKTGLEKWTSDVYGLNLSTDDCAAVKVVPPVLGEEEKDPQLPSKTARAMTREIRVSLRCKGVDKRRMDKIVLAHVGHAWFPRHQRCADGKKRASCKIEAEKPAKRSKQPFVKVDQTVSIGISPTDNTLKETGEGEHIRETSGAVTDVTDAPGVMWNWLEESSNAPPVSKRQSLPDDLILQEEDCLGRNSFIPLRSLGEPLKVAEETGVRCDRSEDNAEVFMERLSALIVPGIESAKYHMQSEPKSGVAWRKRLGTDAVHVLDVSLLSLEQRVLVQLNGVGLIDSNNSSKRGQLQDLAEKIKILNRCSVSLHQGVNAGS